MNFQKSDKSQAMAINSNSGAHTDFQKSDKRQAMAINSNSGAHTDLQKSDKGPALAINSHTQARTDFQSILDRNPQNYSDSFRNRLLSAQRICHHPLPEEAVLDLLDLTSAYPSDRFPLSYEVFINGVAYACSSYINEPGRFGASPAYVNYVRTTRIMKDDIRGFICQHRSELDGLDLVVGDDTLCTQLRNRIRNTLPDIYTTSSVPNRIENSSPEAGKGAALRFLCSRLGIRTEDSIAFGDADNDIDLLTSAGIGIAMENGTERCREAADYVTGRHDRDGVAEALRTRFAI
jgi:hydroxymethylpyrimidine pyrophosphatase-like HAD family hydrolase